MFWYSFGDDEPSAIDIIGADITIYCHALDLALPPADLLASIDVPIDGIVGRLDIATN